MTSRLAPISQGQRTTPVKRRPLSKAEHLRKYVSQLGLCGCGCGFLMIPGEIDEQHEPPHEERKFDWNYNGKPDVLFRRDCHHRETREKDLPRIVQTRHMGGGKGSQRAKRKNESYRPIMSRGFDKKLTKGFDGKVRRK